MSFLRTSSVLTLLVVISCGGSEDRSVDAPQAAQTDQHSGASVDDPDGAPAQGGQGESTTPGREPSPALGEEDCGALIEGDAHDAMRARVAECVATCVDQPSTSACVETCVALDAYLSPACRPCVEEFAQCWSQVCEPECRSGATADGCDACLSAQCVAPFAQCLGVERADDKGGCLSAADVQVLDLGIDELLDGCAVKCQTEPSLSACVSECIATEAGLSTGCSACVGDFTQCIAVSCAQPCQDSSNTECLECIALSCQSAYEACTGLHTGVSACATPSDEALLDTRSTTEFLEMCEQVCAGVDDPMACGITYFSGFGFEVGCAECHGQLFGCMKGPCEVDCADITSESCGVCLDTYCRADFDRCAFGDVAAGSSAFGCSEEQAATLELLDYRAVMSGCLSACTGARQPSTCAAQCVDGAALVEPECMGCVSTLASCIAEACSADCLNGSEDAGCVICSVAACGDAFLSCSGLNAGPQEACLDLQDQAALAESTFLEQYEACRLECQAALNGGHCLASCLQVEPSLSPLCAACFGQELVCHGQKCKEACAEQGVQDYCGACQADLCTPGFMSCSGLEESIVAPVACAGLDQSRVELGVVDAAAETCATACAAEATPGLSYVECVNQCVQQQAFVSPSCAACYSDYASCRLNTCTNSCPSEAECAACVRQTCNQELSICTGVSTQGLMVPGACLNTLDQVTLGAIDAIAAVFTCSQACIDAEDGEACVVSCAQSLTGLTIDCAGCFAPTFVCATTTCAEQCGADSKSAECAACANSECYSTFMVCAGFIADGAQ